MPDTFSPITFYEGENEQALKQEFVRLMAKWGNKYSVFDVCQYIFRELREPGRAFAAATFWQQDLELMDQIDAERVKPVDAELDSRTERLKVLKQIYSDLGASNKDRLEALRLHAQIEGEITKLVDKGITDKTPKQPPVFMFRKYDDSAA